MDSFIVTLISKSIIPLLGAIITYFIVPWLRAKYGKERLDTLTEWSRRAVEAAEKIFPASLNSDKYDYAVAFLVSQAEAHHIKITENEVRTLIESAVSLLPETHKEE